MLKANTVTEALEIGPATTTPDTVVEPVAGGVEGAGEVGATVEVPPSQPLRATESNVASNTLLKKHLTLFMGSLLSKIAETGWQPT
jgi:hypothetical protein